MKQQGKAVKRNIQANKDLKEQYIDQEICFCELGFPGCLGNQFLTFAHRHKRVWYYPKDKQHLLGAMSQTLLACTSCHQKIEVDTQLTKEVFLRLRGEEKL